MVDVMLPPDSAGEPPDIVVRHHVPDDEATSSSRDDFDTFYLRIYRQLVSRAITLGCPRGDAEGLVQDVMVRIWNQWKALDGATRDRYAMVATRNEVINRYRQEQGRRRGQSRLESDQQTRVHTDSEDIETVAVDRLEAASALRFVLLGLSDREREVFLLKYDGLSCVEIADALGIGATSVRTHLHHARTKLKTHLAGRSK